jgi:hypothetical protein
MQENLLKIILKIVGCLVVLLVTSSLVAILSLTR